MSTFTREHISSAIKWGGFVLLGVAALAVFHWFPALTPFVNKVFRYMFLVGAAFALKALAILAMYQMFRTRDMVSFGRACFGFVTGVILGLLVGVWVEDPRLVDNWIQSVPPGPLGVGAFVAGVLISELGALTRRTGHPILVFLCSGTAMILFQLLTLPESSIRVSWLLVFLLGVGCDQMFRFEPRAVR